MKKIFATILYAGTDTAFITTFNNIDEWHKFKNDSEIEDYLLSNDRETAEKYVKVIGKRHIEKLSANELSKSENKNSFTYYFNF